MQLSGQNFIGGQPNPLGEKTFRGMDPARGRNWEPPFHQATAGEIDDAVKKGRGGVWGAGRGITTVRHFSMRSQKRWRRSRRSSPNASPRRPGCPRVQCQRTGSHHGPVADVRGHDPRWGEESRWRSVAGCRIDRGDAERKPRPSRICGDAGGTGTGGGFWGEQFSLAYSGSRGDTAWTRGGLQRDREGTSVASGRVGTEAFRAVLEAARKTNMPEGIVSLVQGIDPEVSIHLVKHPLVKAVGFTGSTRAGRR